MNEGVKILMDSMSELAATNSLQIGFDEAFTLHHRTVFRCAWAVTNDSALAEDVTQEVFLKLYHNLDQFSDDEYLKSWLIRVTINVSRNAIRGNLRANVREQNYVKESEQNAVYEPELELERREEINEIRKTIEKIKEPHRSCLMLKQQGLSYKEIAETLSLNENSIGQYVARARKEFIRFYGKIGGEL